MDDDKEYQELLKAEKQESRDTQIVMRAFGILIVLIAIGLFVAIANYLSFAITALIQAW